MVGYDDGKKTTLKNTFWAGALGGMCTRVCITPLDVLKIRFQLQADIIGVRSKYYNIPQATKLILKEEGIVAFWKGHCPAQILSIICGGMQFMTFQYFTQVAHTAYPNSNDKVFSKTMIHLGCGSLSGIVASFCSHPVDVLRTRFAAQKEPKLYTSMLGATRHIIVNEGWRSLFRGMTPSLLQVAPQTGVSFGSYSLLQGVWIESYKEGPLSHFVCGASSGVISKATVYPMDLLKKRLQVQGFFGNTISNVVEYRNVRHCALVIYQTEGIRGFYKGLTAAALKSCLTVGLLFLTYEFFSDILRDRQEARRPS